MSYSSMFFSSNQKLEISGPLDEEYIKYVLQVFFKLSGQDKHISKVEYERGCKVVYQISKNGNYCIGWGFKNIPNGWQEYQFDFDYSIVSLVIKQFLEKKDKSEFLDYNKYISGDGTTEKGFFARVIGDAYSEEEVHGIENPFYGIVEFSPYAVYYAK